MKKETNYGEGDYSSAACICLFRCFYLFVTEIINVTAIIEMQMPSMMFVVSGSPNITVPTRIAVMGSNTPSTDAFVAPMLRVAMARDAVDTIVGSNARPIRLSHAAPPSMPAVIAVLERAIFPRNTIAPTVKA